MISFAQSLLVLAAVASVQDVRTDEAKVQMSASSEPTPELDKALGIQRVSNFDEMVACIRSNNSAGDVELFVAERAPPEKVRRFFALTHNCWPDAKATIETNLEAFEVALSAKGRTK